MQSLSQSQLPSQQALYYYNPTSGAFELQLGHGGAAASLLYAYQPSTLSYVALTVDASGNLNTVGGGGSGGGNAAAGPTGSPVPASADYTGWNSGGNLVGVALASALPVQPGTGATFPVSGTFWQATQPVSIAASVAVTGTFWQATQPVSLAASVSVTGIVADATAFTRGTTVELPVGGVVEAVQAGLTTGQTRALSLTTAALLRVDGSNVTQPVSISATVTVAGTVTANQGTAAALAGAWPTELTDGTNGPAAVKAASTAAVAADKALVVAVSPNNSVAVTGTFFQATQPVSIAATVSENLLQVASTTLGTPQTFGTAPTGVVIGTSSDMYIAGTRARSNQATTAAGVQDVNVVGLLGVTAVTAAAGISKVGISGAAAATLDSVTTAATTPANALAVSVANVTTAPSLTTGQSVALQAAWDGSVFVKPHRRSNTKAATGTFTSTTATSLLAAQAAGVFADLAGISITQGLGATANVFFTVNISDGTATYKFNLYSPSAVTNTGPPSLNLNFDPPIPATSAATAWTVALSSATDTPTVNVTAVFVLQKAS